MKFGEPVVIWKNSAAQQKKVDGVDQDEGEHEVEGVHENFAEELDFEA